MGYALEAFMDHLMQEEYTENTLSKYRRDLSRSLEYQGDQPMTKELVIRYKKSQLLHYRAASVNSMLAAVNHYLEYAGYSACKVHTVRIQKKIYTEDDRILTRKEYARLLQSCSDPRTQLIMETLCSTGIRVSELHYITVENYRKKMIKVYNKGKERVVFLPDRLIAHLRRYVKKRKITSGEIFISRTGKRLDRTAIWRMMKRLCAKAGVDQKKVFPHNLRHLFATTYYRMKKDISKLADLLGHSSIETTRIYILESSRSHYQDLENMHLVI